MEGMCLIFAIHRFVPHIMLLGMFVQACVCVVWCMFVTVNNFVHQSLRFPADGDLRCMGNCVRVRVGVGVCV